MRLRITLRPNTEPAEDLRVAAELRRDLWAHSPVEIDPDQPLHGTHRDEHGRAYFEFATDCRAEVDRVLREHGYADCVEVTEVRETAPVGPACQSCGNVAGPVLPTVCPSCGFRDIAACPACSCEVPRQSYARIAGDLFRCPHCRNQIRFRFNEPVVLADGTYNEPLVVTEET